MRTEKGFFASCWERSLELQGTWFSGGLGSVRLMVGLDDLKGLFQIK